MVLGRQGYATAVEGTNGFVSVLKSKKVIPRRK